MVFSSHILLCCFKRPLHSTPYVDTRSSYCKHTVAHRLWHVRYMFLCMHPINLQAAGSLCALAATSPVSAITLQPGFTESMG